MRVLYRDASGVPEALHLVQDPNIIRAQAQ